MLCCFDDKGHSDCIVGLATVLGEALGVDVTHKDVNRNTADRTPTWKQNNNEWQSSNTPIVNICAPEY